MQDISCLIHPQNLTYAGSTVLVSNLPRVVVTHVNAIDLRGRAKRGQRCLAAIPHGHWQTTTFAGALRQHAMTAPMVLDKPMNGEAFVAYTRQATSMGSSAVTC